MKIFVLALTLSIGTMVALADGSDPMPLCRTKGCIPGKLSVDGGPLPTVPPQCGACHQKGI